MLEVIRYNLLIALEAIVQNRLRAFLTSLGIIFGVASVIAMLAIGKGAEQQILEQMKLLGTNNIIVQPVVEQEEGNVADDEQQKPQNKRFSPGLTLSDLNDIREILPSIYKATPEIIGDVLFVRDGIKKTGKLIGVSEDYFDISATELESGQIFADANEHQSMPVAVIGKSVKTKFFAGTDPIGKQIKCGPLWFTVIGVLKERGGGNSTMRHLGIRDFDMDIYIPATTFLLRFKNRSLLTERDIKKANSGNNNDDEETDKKSTNYHQIDRMILHVKESAYIKPTADVASRLLQRKHNEVVDYEVIIPELLLQQEQRTKRIFNIVLSSIASISLLVGGIGIMNIMFASVVERYKEIGTRMAIGARKLDIKLQFLTEALVISLSGGIAGILFGISLSYIIESATEIKTLVSLVSIVISFGVSISVGLVFGIFPAIKAAEQEPADVLRYE
ncbi:FtsX-like permease family protein [bacterium]|nr:MAG: FtsX-like permease family protein [bacterium]